MTNNRKKLPKTVFVAIVDFEGLEPVFLVSDSKAELCDKDDIYTYVGTYKLEKVEKLALEVKTL